MFRTSPSATLLLLVVVSLAVGLATMPLLKVALEAAIPASTLLAGLTRAELPPDGAADGAFTWDFGRISRRWLVLVTVVTFVLSRRHVAWTESIRSGLRDDPRWRRHLGVGLAAGLAATVTYFGVLYLGGRLVWVPRSPARLVEWIVEYAIGAAIVAWVEEVFFRAVMLRTMIRDWGVAVAVTASTAVFAVVHAISGQLRVASGWDPTISLRLLRVYFTGPDGSVSEDLRIIAGLALLGSLLCLVVLRTGSLWAAIGLHGAMVLSSRLGKQVLYPADGYVEWLLGDRSVLVAGVVPWLVLALAIALVVIWPRSRTAPQPDPGRIRR